MHENKPRVLMAASVASMIDQFNMPNIELLQQLGYEVHVACNFKEGNTCDKERIKAFRKNLRDMHVRMHQWDCPRDIRSVSKCVRAYRQILKLLESYRFAWMHCHSPVGGALARLAAHKLGVRTVYTAHGFHFYKGAPLKNWLLYYPAEKLLAHWTDVLITVNKEDYRFAEKKLRAGSIYRIPGIGIDLETYAAHSAAADLKTTCGKEALCKKYRIPDKARILLSVGELNKGKNHKLAIEALAALHKQDVYYLICGQGILREELWRFAEQMGVGSRVRLPGYQEEMPYIYQGADIFVFPSKREGMPAALMEAMAAGMACAVSDIRGNRELIEDSFRFPPGRPRQLAALLEMLLDDQQLRQELGCRNREKVGTYSREAVSRKMLKIYLKMKTADGNVTERSYCMPFRVWDLQ